MALEPVHDTVEVPGSSPVTPTERPAQSGDLSGFVDQWKLEGLAEGSFFN